MRRYQPQQLQLVTEANSVVQVGDAHDYGAVVDSHSQYCSLVAVVVGTTLAGFRSSRRPERQPSAAAGTETETVAQRTQSLVED